MNEELEQAELQPEQGQVDSTPTYEQEYDSVFNGTPLEQPKESAAQEATHEQEVVDEPQQTEQETKPALEPFKIKRKGMEFEFPADDRPTIEKALNMMFDYTQKMQEIKPLRDYLPLIESGQLTPQELSMFIDMKKGNKEALAQFVKEKGIDPFELPSESNYRPQPLPQINHDLNDTVARIEQDTENAVKLGRYIEVLDEQHKQVLRNPAILEAFYIDVKNGAADKIMPEVVKTLAINPSLDFVQTYQYIAQRTNGTQPAQPQPALQKATPEQKQKATAAPKTTTISTKHLSDAEEVWAMDDAAFKAKLRQITS